MVRSAMEPETIVAAVAQNTVWNTMYTHRGDIQTQVAVIALNERIKPADERAGTCKHDAEADQPEARCADAEVHHVFHQDVAGVFWRG